MGAALEWICVFLGAGTALVSILVYLVSALSSLRVPRFEDQSASEPQTWPRLSVVVPAKDEGGGIRAALESLLAQDYPDLEIVLVDDRSRDDTGAVMDELAAADPRVTVVHVRDRPDDWLGKVHAMQRGTERATGALLLYQDADIHMSEGFLRRAVALFEHEKLDHLALFPGLISDELWQTAFGCAFSAGYVQRTLGSRQIEQPPDRHFGFGAFNLVRREVLERSEGLEWIRLDVLDDLAIAPLIKNAGGRAGFLTATRDLKVEWYATFRQALASLDKNFFGGMARYQAWRALALFAATYVVALGPFLVFAQSRVPWLWVVIPLVLLALIFDAAAGRRLGRPFGPALLTPIIQMILAVKFPRSAWRALREGGIHWREDFYPIAQLRAGQRVTYP